MTIDVTRVAESRYAALTRLDLSGYEISDNLKLVMVAKAGATFCRMELGTVGSWDKSPQLLQGLDPRGFQRFRLLVHAVNDPQLVASAENLLARDLEQADSFLAMEPADLGEVVWELSWSNEEPVLLFNQDIFPNARGATGYPPFCALVLPEVVRQVARKIASDPAKLVDENDVLRPWAGLLERLGIDEVPGDPDDESEKEMWVGSVVAAFAAQARLATDLKRLLNNAD